MKTYDTMKKIRHLLLLLTALFFSACSDQSPFIDTATNSADADVTTDPTVDPIVSSVRIGSIVSGTFTDGVLLTTPNAISAGGTSIITVELVDETGVAVTTSNTVTFSSPCVTDGTADLSNPSYLTTNGTATTNYTASGCTGSDVVTVTLGGTTQTASGTVTVASATAGSLEHTLNNPALIALAGTGSALGLPETSTVTFTVKDGLGLPVQGETVTFSLNSTLGGITLSTITATSDNTGQVVTTVQSGTVATNVQVTATLDSNTNINTVSSTIAIATGPPSQNNISIGAAQLNPRVWNTIEKLIAITVSVGDRFGNLVTDGTLVSFRTELGNIDSNCSTINGSCSVNWHSGLPQENFQTPEGNPGVTTIMAFVEGEESFVDKDSNGVFSNGDEFIGAGFNFDLEEAYVDGNENNVYDSDEESVDFNSSFDHDLGDTKYNGKGCIHDTDCSAADSINVWTSMTMVLGEDDPAVYLIEYDGVTVSPISNPPTFYTRNNSSISYTIGGLVNGRILPVGSVVSFTTTNGKIAGDGSHTVANAVGAAQTYTVTIERDTTPSEGSLTAKVVVGDGGGTFTFPSIAINDEPTSYTIGGSISGIPVGESLVIKNNGGDNLSIPAGATTFVFTNPVFDGEVYGVTVGLAPTSATCTIGLGSGKVTGSNISDIVITCAP